MTRSITRARASKRALDLAAGVAGLGVLAPALGGIAAAIWFSDRGNPFYAARRVGLDGREFTMLKFRTMVANADRIGGASTGNRDPRITPIGRVLRATKADELPQLINVAKGDMSLVGPRPNISWEVATYSEQERVQLSVRPGITDLASIVFADEGAILADQEDPDLAYEQLIRPWKSRLGVLYAQNASVAFDVRIVLITLLNAVDRPAALRFVSKLVGRLGGTEDLVAIAGRQVDLTPGVPPGHTSVIDRVPA